MDISSFFVSGFADDTRREEIWDSFGQYGELIDVYVGSRKDVKGKNFAFVIF